MAPKKVIVSWYGFNHIAVQDERTVISRRAECGSYWTTTFGDDVDLTKIDCLDCLYGAVAESVDNS